MAADGHDPVALQEHLSAMKRERGGRPKALIAKTIKGRGVPGLANEALANILAPAPALIDSLLGDQDAN